MPFFAPSSTFVWSANEDGIAIRFEAKKQALKARQLKGTPLAQSGIRRMQMLLECGDAEVRSLDEGIFIHTPDAVRLDQDSRKIFELPPHWPGGMRLKTTSAPNLHSFYAQLALYDYTIGPVWNWRLRGPVLEVADQFYLPTAAQYAALAAFQAWHTAEVKDEIANLSLIATLRDAHGVGCLIDLEAYKEQGGVVVANANELTIAAQEDTQSGDLVLVPSVLGDFPAISSDEIEKRIAQLAGQGNRAVLRVGKTIVLLDEVQTAQARAIVKRARVPKSERDEFESNPQRWLLDNVFPDIPAEFSPRVTGIGEWKGGYLGSAFGESEDWFGKQPEPEKPEQPTKTRLECSIEDTESDELAQPEKPAVLLPLIIPNDTELGYGWASIDTSRDENIYRLDFSTYARQPLPHQEDAIRWLLWHARRATHKRDVERGQHGYGAGALLADDMGLGKSFSTLIALAEWLMHWREEMHEEPPAVLLVVPLSLTENWRSEINLTFKTSSHPFRRVVMAHPDFELNQFKKSPHGADIAEPGLVREFGLCFGDHTERSLDWPGSCVITTYQTLRDYRFSFAAAHWSAVVFDEAQNIKNPNAQQTVAAKALRGLLRIALTGTPVENHLGDFWCILDTAEPGPLGAYADFRKRWISPMIRERDRMNEIGTNLRDHVGGLMLRRTKAEELKELLPKTIIVCDCPMTDEQQRVYAQSRDSVHAEVGALDGIEQRQHLAALWHLRQSSLHPDLIGGGSIQTGRTAKDCRQILSRSGKLEWLLKKLDEIRDDGEKVLIFCVLKQLQEALSRHLEIIYEIPVPIINGDTKATSRTAPAETRLGLIQEFSSRRGFAVCVLSPIAAGAGLNIVSANHVIHLERHWNPAKEDQATDRAYRIGQTLPVSVYLPSSTHPEFPSFDCILHRLLEKKRGLQGALGLIPPDSVSAPELMAEIFGHKSEQKVDLHEPLSLDACLRFSWQMFEALIAVIYGRNAERVILTPYGSDYGSDVIVIGWGPLKSNILVQCKKTDNPILDSGESVREVASSQPFYEQPLGVVFDSKAVHTTARSFGRRSKQASAVCSVALHGRNWLDDALRQYRPTLQEVLIRDARRERVR
ncbi:MAG: SNF2-related protein [Prosthecobacter sp.]